MEVLLNPGNSSFGGLIRNNTSLWTIGFLGTIGILTSLHVELKKLHFGLSCNKKFVCHTNSHVVIKLVAQELQEHHRYAYLIKSIQDLLLAPWEVVL